ncbi:nicotinate-nucleotide adenylyltransferase [Metamycoplasma equirhinis]|uniref:nicotinate-nucleotide adenylyltransferase n=1 Tax=Metamycoplasma equirhinis TaxID=92402 RepID=UPI0025746098|nr:nicotinate-nucleotide adenylyltransferase [Metamycoplasma equirhinis]BDX52774.1 nicotinate-nucleotide adenylyltransferase [Metamycoplasma equirhinis]
MKIGIFGGSFNPIHKGHILIASDALQLLNLDQIIFVPTNCNPFKKKSDYVDNKHRIEMIKLVLKNKMSLSEFETNQKGTSYTINTIQFFKNKFPEDELYLLVGSDNVNKLNKWKDIDLISKLAKICIFNRNNKFSKINIKKYNCILLNNEFHDFSSTKYRLGNLNQVEPEVQKYIAKNFLYFSDIAKNWLSPERYKHLRFTAEFAAALAKNNNFSVKAAYQAGFMHDITKEWSQEKCYSFLKKFGFNKNNLEPHKLHQNTAYYWLKNNYMFEDEEILHAIKIHTTLDFELSVLDKILYVSDKLCEGRKWKGVQKSRKLALINLNEGLKEAITKCGIEFNNQKGITLSDQQKKIYKKWL